MSGSMGEVCGTACDEPEPLEAAAPVATLARDFPAGDGFAGRSGVMDFGLAGGNAELRTFDLRIILKTNVSSLN